MKVTYIFRKRKSGYHSVEKIYKSIGEDLKNKITIEYIEAPFHSTGLFKRLANIIYFQSREKNILHVTGDVNYIALNINKKIILTILDCVMFEKLKGYKKTLYKYLWLKWPSYFAKKIIVLSNSIKSQLVEYVGIDPNKIEVIPVALSDKIKKNEKVFNKNKPEIIIIGTAWNKNIHRCFEAVKDIKCKLTIIGKLTKDDIAKLEENKFNYENYYDITEDQVYKFYQRSDILLFPSLYEGFGMPIIEANAIGRPVITSNLEPMSNVAGDAACLVDPLEVSQITIAIMRIINEDEYRNKLINSGYLNSEKYQLNSISKKYYDLYEEIK